MMKTAYDNSSSTIYYASSIADFNTGTGTRSITGDGIKEVWKSNYTGWFSDYLNFPYTTYLFFVRSGVNNNERAADGMFVTTFGHRL